MTQDQAQSNIRVKAQEDAERRLREQEEAERARQRKAEAERERREEEARLRRQAQTSQPTLMDKRLAAAAQHRNRSRPAGAPVQKHAPVPTNGRKTYQPKV